MIKPSLAFVVIIRFEPLVQLKQGMRVLMQDIDLEGRAEVAVKRPRLLPAQPLLGHEVSVANLQVFLCADWDLLEFPLSFNIMFCRHQQ